MHTQKNPQNPTLLSFKMHYLFQNKIFIKTENAMKCSEALPRYSTQQTEK